MSDIAIEVEQKSRVPVTYLQAECGVRYWEDAAVNGVEDTDGTLIPCRDPKPNDHLGGGTWRPLIELATGRIVDWPQGTTADIHYKVCDDGAYHLLDAERNVVSSIDGYVPNMMCPEGDGYGDYVIMKIGPDGAIAVLWRKRQWINERRHFAWLDGHRRVGAEGDLCLIGLKNSGPRFRLPRVSVASSRRRWFGRGSAARWAPC